MAVRIGSSSSSLLVINKDKLETFAANAATKTCLTKLAQLLHLPTYFANLASHSEADVQDVLERVAKGDEIKIRAELLIAGVDLEESISIVVLEALARGFKVFLLADFIHPSDNYLAKFCWDRLIQAGAIPTTTLQIGLEIASSEQNEELSTEVKNLLAECNRVGV